MQIQAAKLVEPAKILLIVLIAYLLADTVWYFVSGPSVTHVTKAEKRSRATNRSPVSVEEIAAMNLFGQTSAVPVAAEPSAFDAPETGLRLTLEGVFQSENPEQSAAIVAEQGRPGELYLVGDNLPGNAVLAEVYADRIVLRRGAVFETLRFSDEPTLLTTAEPPAAGGSRDDPGAYSAPFTGPDGEFAEDGNPQADANRETLGETIGETLEHYKSRLSEDAEGTLNELGLEPVNTASAEGYRLANLSASPYLAQTGLQPGDVILSVNGRPVGDVQQDRQEIDNIVAQGSARLEVQRGERRFFVTASLK